MTAALPTLKLYQIADDYLQALAALAEMDDVPPQAIADTLDGLSGTFERKAANVAAYIRTLEAEAAAIEDARKAMERRETALRRQAAGLRAYLKDQMERTALTLITSSWLTLRVQANPPSVVIEDETLLPAGFTQVVTSVKVLKAELGTTLKAGQTIAGAHLEQSTRLVIT